MDHKTPKESVLRTWFVISIITILILFQGVLSFSVVGDLGQPDWDFGVIKDVPGGSPYAIYRLDNPQHVRGLEEERKVKDIQ